jgi:DNA modification methylase
MSSLLILGDCRAVMAELDPDSIDAIVTDPPYDLTAGKQGGTGAASVNLDSPYGRSRISTGNGGFMGLDWDATGIAFDPDTWAEARRVLKPGGHLLAFGGTRTFHRMTVAIEDAGFEIRDCLSWLYASGFPKSLDVSKAIDKHLGAERTEVIGTAADFARDGSQRATDGSHVEPGYSGGYGDRWAQLLTVPATPEGERWAGFGTALKPAWEPIVMARKPLAGTIAANVLAHGTGGLNIDACRIGYQSDADQASAIPQGRATAKTGALAGGAQNDNHRTEFAPSNDIGRWPGNVLLDEGAAAMLDEQSGERKSGAMNGTYVSWGTQGIHGAGNARRVTATASTGGASRFFFVAKAPPSERTGVDGVRHPTQKPLALMRQLVRLVTPRGGVVLDPFAGSGSTLVAAEAEGFASLGIELTPDYLDIAERRVKAVMGMFADVEVRR